MRLAVTALFVILNGLFVAAEFALVKLRVMRIDRLAAQGHPRAILVRKILSRMNLYLSACQLGITLSSLILGWLAEPAVARGLLWVADAAGISMSPNVLHFIALALALTIVTILHMTIGEQAPKIWSLHRAEKTAFALAWPLRIFTLLFQPLIMVINGMSNMMLRGVGLDPNTSEETPPDAGELAHLLALSAEAGHITDRQEEIGKRVMEIKEIEVRHILVPRRDVVHLSLSASREENLDRVRSSGHSRFPLCDEDLDAVKGVVHAKHVLLALLDGESADLETLARPAVFVPDTLPLSRLIHDLRRARAGCGVVRDEHGTTVGMAFLEDAVERIVGPIRDEFDEKADDVEVRELSAGGWELAGDMALPDAGALLGLPDVEGEATLGGYVTDRLEKRPEVGDELVLGAYRLQVTEVGDGWVKRLQAVPDEETS